MMGGEWEQGVRTMRITWDALSRTSGMATRLHTLAGVAGRTDRKPDKQMLAALAREANKLHAEIERYVDRVLELDREIGLYAALVLRARDEAPEPEAEAHPDLGDEDLIDRMGALYGIPKPRNRR
jgi:hypothetical protein